MDIREIGIQEMRILPPGPGKCPVCAVEHDAQQPHDAQSLYYRMKFRQQHGRFPTWWDAMAHCDQATKDLWLDELKANGVDVGDPPEKEEAPSARNT
ncbi:MAG: hypothetical protein ACOYI6_04320 [Christensenellales bacterium]